MAKKEESHQMDILEEGKEHKGSFLTSKSGRNCWVHFLLRGGEVIGGFVYFLEEGKEQVG